ncbi:MAG: class E sortase [Ancrocorticia sp.]|jgi:LPXTG-site transpeptidase (sortase) family protein|nr:class E sortase [Ancrocorticia sp.]
MGATSINAACHVKRRTPSMLWRIVGVVGELFITAGLVILLFIVWQVWWTDVGAHRQQAAAVEQVLNSWGTPESSQSSDEKIGQPRDTAPPEPEAEQEGEVFGIVRIPRFGADYAVSIVEGTSIDLLNTGAYGHYEESQLPGEIGNFALAAHRQTYGAPLRNVDQLQEGDAIVIQTKNAYLIYKVTTHYIVWPDESDVILPVPREPGVTPTERLLTLTTCHPPFVSDQRWIVHATFDHWVDPADGVPVELTEEVK